MNALLGRTGSVFAERYSARELKSPKEERNTRAYVLNNARRYDAERGLEWEDGTIDPYSSWAWFDGWRDCSRELFEEARAGPEAERPVANARTWLLREGWRRHGLPADLCLFSSRESAAQISARFRVGNRRRSALLTNETAARLLGSGRTRWMLVNRFI